MCGGRRSWRGGKTWSALVLCALLVVFGVGCSGSDDETGAAEGTTADSAESEASGFVVGFSNGICNNAWRRQALAGIELKADEYKSDGTVSDLVVSCAQGDIQRQISDIQGMIAQEVDILLVIPLSDAVGQVVSDATKRGIVTVPFNLPLGGGADYTSFVGVDPCRKAEKNAEWLSEQIGSDSNVVGLGGTAGNAYTDTGWDCATKVFEEKGVNPLTLRPADWETSTAKRVMADLLASYPSIDGVWTDGGNNAVGAIQALQDAGLPLIPMTGDDYNGLLKSWAELRQDNPDFEISAVPEPPDGESMRAFDLGVMAAKGESVPQEELIDVDLYTGETLAEIVQPELPDDMYAVTNLPQDVLDELFR